MSFDSFGAVCLYKAVTAVLNFIAAPSCLQQVSYHGQVHFYSHLFISLPDILRTTGREKLFHCFWPDALNLPVSELEEKTPSFSSELHPNFSFTAKPSIMQRETMRNVGVKRTYHSRADKNQGPNSPACLKIPPWNGVCSFLWEPRFVPRHIKVWLATGSDCLGKTEGKLGGQLSTWQRGLTLFPCCLG